MSTWLLKTEPQDCSIDTIRDVDGGVMRWDGIRNYQARNCLRDDVRLADLCLIYHSGKPQPQIVGAATVVRAAYPDPAQFDAASEYFDPGARATAPRWFCVDIRYLEHFPRQLTLAAIKQRKELATMMLVRHGRLSVQPVSAAECRVIGRLCGASSACLPH